MTYNQAKKILNNKAHVKRKVPLDKYFKLVGLAHKVVKRQEGEITPVAASTKRDEPDINNIDQVIEYFGAPVVE